MVDGYYYDARKLHSTLDSDDLWTTRDCELPPQLEKLAEVGEETVLICYGNSALCELKYNELVFFFLRYGFNVRVYNHPGYGNSQREDYIDSYMMTPITTKSFAGQGGFYWIRAVQLARILRHAAGESIKKITAKFSSQNRGV